MTETFYSKRPTETLLHISPRPGDSCPLDRYQVRARDDLLIKYGERINALEDELKAWRVAASAGVGTLIAVLYAFDWLWVNLGIIRSALATMIG